MGRVPRPPPGERLRLRGQPALPRDHRQDHQGDRHHDHLRRRADVRRHREGHHALHDLTAQDGQECGVLQ